MATWTPLWRRSPTGLRRLVRRESDGDAALELGRRAWRDRRDLRGARQWVRLAARLGDEEAPFYETWLATKARRGSTSTDANLVAGLDEILCARRNPDYGAGRASLRRAARRDDPVAQACYGLALAWTGSCKDARRWLLRAAPRVPWAAAVLASFWDFLDVSRRQANRWLRLAAEGGHLGAQNDWGETLRDGPEWGVPRDLRGAVGWLRRAAERGHVTAQLNLGVLLHEGKGVRRDDHEAARWYRRAARMGDAAAMANLARCYRKGHGVRRDVRAAMRWFRRSAALDDGRAGGDLADIYFHGKGVRRNPRQALRWARPFIASFESVVLPPDRPADGRDAHPSFEGLHPLRRDALAEAYHVVGACAEDGKGTARDDAASFRAYSAAAAAGHSCATYDVACAYEDGRGVAKDLRRARTWYRRAAKLGDTRTRPRLKALGRIRRR